MWPASGSSCRTLYSHFVHKSSKLHVCPTTWTSLSSSQQHLVICSLEINTTMMCGSLFILSQRNVFSKLNHFGHSVDTLQAYLIVLAICGGLLGLNPSAVCCIWTLLLVWPNLLYSLSAWCFHSRCLTWRTPALAERSGVKWRETSERSGQEKKSRIEYRGLRWRWRKVKTSLQRSPKLIFFIIPWASTWG